MNTPVLDQPTERFYPGSGSLPLDEANEFPVELLLLYDPTTDKYACNNVTFTPDNFDANMLAAFPYLDDVMAYQGIHPVFKSFRHVGKTTAQARQIALERELLAGVALWVDGKVAHHFFVR